MSNVHPLGGDDRVTFIVRRSPVVLITYEVGGNACQVADAATHACADPTVVVADAGISLSSRQTVPEDPSVRTHPDIRYDVPAVAFVTGFDVVYA